MVENQKQSMLCRPTLRRTGARGARGRAKHALRTGKAVCVGVRRTAASRCSAFPSWAGVCISGCSLGLLSGAAATASCAAPLRRTAASRPAGDRGVGELLALPTAV